MKTAARHSNAPCGQSRARRLRTEKLTTGEAPCEDTCVLDKPKTRAEGWFGTH